MARIQVSLKEGIRMRVAGLLFCASSEGTSSVGQIFADGGDTWNYVSLIVTASLAIGGAVSGYLMKTGADDRKAQWDAIKELQQDNKACDRERAEIRSDVNHLMGFSPSRPRPPQRHREDT